MTIARMQSAIAIVCSFLLAGMLSLMAAASPVANDDSHTSKQFKGAKANTGTVTHHIQKSMHMLTLSDDFVVPDAPAPHWQIVDSKGNVYLLQRLIAKAPDGEHLNKSIAIPTYIQDIAKVQIWCAWAETLLGETTFGKTIKLKSLKMMPASVTTSQFMGVKANTGTATFSHQGNKRLITLSDDFRVPDAPAPHWQLVDSQGNAYLLQRLVIKGDMMHKSIEIPAYVPDVAKVQIWCAYAEVLLGEAAFEMPVK